MTCARAINLARRHAALCDEIELYAPPVDNSYLGQALRRMRLPIRVKPTPNNVGRWLSPRAEDGFNTSIGVCGVEIAAAYRALCESLTHPPPTPTDPAPTSLPANADG